MSNENLDIFYDLAKKGYDHSLDLYDETRQMRKSTYTVISISAVVIGVLVRYIIISDLFLLPPLLLLLASGLLPYTNREFHYKRERLNPQKVKNVYEKGKITKKETAKHLSKIAKENDEYVEKWRPLIRYGWWLSEISLFYLLILLVVNTLPLVT